MDWMTKSDMQSAMQYLRDDMHQTVVGRQDLAALLAKMTSELVTQMREQQATSRQISAQLNQLSQRLPAIEHDISYFKKDLQQLTHK